MAAARLNLRSATTLLVDRDHFTRGLVAQMLRGFGMESPTVVETGAQAKRHLLHHYADLCIVEAVMPDMPSGELIRWIRRQSKSPFRFVPIIVMSGYTQLRLVSSARDAGANLVVRKPVSPQSLFDRIAWVATSARPYIEAGEFIGPDRRFRDIAPPGGQLRRESDGEQDDGGELPQSVAAE